MPTDNDALEKFLQVNKFTKFIRLQWVDYSGVLHARFVPVSRCVEIDSGAEIICLPQSSMLKPISMGTGFNSSLTGGSKQETFVLCPDWSSLRRCGFKANHATVMSFIDHKGSNVGFDKCPRTMLIHPLNELNGGLRAKAMIGFTIEFMLLDEFDNLIKPIDRLNGDSRAAGLRGDTLDLVEEIVDALEQSSIRISHFYTERQDRIKLALAPESVLKAVDSLIMAQETIRTICIRRKLKATMSPRPTTDEKSNGLYLHLSFDELDQASIEKFIAGVLSNMDLLCAFGMANHDSYVRSTSDYTGEWIGFGTDNRNLPVRKIANWHWELRMMDSTANPYLFVAAVLLAGMDGIKKQRKLEWSDCTKFPQRMDDKMRAEYGLERAMLTTFIEALDRLKRATTENSIIGEELLKWFIAVKEKDVEEFEKMTESERRIRFLEYF